MIRTHFAAGSIYYIPDLLLKLPGDNAGGRTHHPQRPVLIVSDQQGRHGTNAQPSHEWSSVLVVPLSSATTGRTRFDVKFNAGEGNLSKKSWARIPALQAVDKDHLGDLLGTITDEKLAEVTAKILDYMGLIDPTEDETEYGSEPELEDWLEAEE